MLFLLTLNNGSRISVFSILHKIWKAVLVKRKT
jgi:hypothetical protein